MELVASKIILFTTLVVCSYTANRETPGLTVLTDYDCGCPGQNASYICTAIGGVITVWGGTAFNCTGRNEISLRHHRFGPEVGSAIGVCNDGALVAYSIEVVENCYTSRLDVRLSTDLQGRIITCSVDDGVVTPIGNMTLIVSTPSVPPPSPERISTIVANDNPQKLIFSWDQVDYNCPTLQYNFTSQNCGTCAANTSRAVSCTEFQASPAGIDCTFTVWSVICGNITGSQSMQSTNVNLKVPDAPTIDTLPRYQNGQIQLLIELMTTFPTVAPTFISDGIDGSIEHYTITYSDSTFGSSCGTANVPVSSCVDGICTHSFDILQSSSCPPSTTIIVSVVASNVLGSGPPSIPVIREGINNLVTVNFDKSIMCTFLNQPPGIVKQCSANITYGEDCNRFLGVFSGMDTEDIVVTQRLERVPGVIEYCFLVIAEANNVTVLVNGTLHLDSQTSPIAAIVVPLVFILLMLILLVVLVVIFVVKHLKIPKSTVHVAFSVKDKPGSLAAALKVFKDCNIYILGLNTHLHHAEFDRSAGDGYQYNYVHCTCTKDEKEFLKNELKAELEGDDQEHVTEHVTAILKVKDHSLGALWNAIHKIGNHGINITGVNTRSKCENTPGYKDNHVKCCCSEGKLRRVHTQLKILTGKEAVINYLDEAEHREERAIEYLVKDEVGALASTLGVVSEMGINISDINPDHLPEDVCDDRTRKRGLKINFIDCSIDKNTKERLFNKLKTQYGAIEVENHDAPPDNLKVDKDHDYTIVKVTGLNETGSLNRILKAFHDLRINIHGVNILKPAFPWEMEIPYKHYHLEITATSEQEVNLKKRLLAEGLAIGIKPFHLTKHQEPDQANDIQNSLQSHYESAETENTAEMELDVTPTSKVIQFLLRDEVGTLANTLQIFDELGISITKINPAHLSREHQDEFVEYSCAKDQRESLISKLKSYGAMNVEEVKHVKFDDGNHCAVKFSVGHEVGSITEVLKAFLEMGVKIHKVNPPYIKVHNQYVECCCTEVKQTELLRRLGEVVGVTDVAIVAENLVSVKPTEDPNYCIIKYSVDEKPGTLVRALKVFCNLGINIIGVNTLNLAFSYTVPVKCKHNHVVLVATDEEVEDLKRELLITGLALDVRPYNRIKHSNDSEALQLGNSMDGNDTTLSSRV